MTNIRKIGLVLLSLSIVGMLIYGLWVRGSRFVGKSENYQEFLEMGKNWQFLAKKILPMSATQITYDIEFPGGIFNLQFMMPREEIDPYLELFSLKESDGFFASLPTNGFIKIKHGTKREGFWVNNNERIKMIIIYGKEENIIQVQSLGFYKSNEIE